MLKVDLKTFKTTKCDRKHNLTLCSSLSLNCPYYHDKSDRRRCPFTKDGKQLVYGQGYVEDYYASWYCSNMVQYLFHPNNYKTKQCTHRMSPNYSQNSSNIQKCPYAYCPYIHANEDVSQLENLRGMPCQALENQITQIKGRKQCIQLINNPVLIQNHRQDIDTIKQRFRKVSSSCKEERLARSKSVMSPAAALHAAQGEGHKDFKDWYTHYNYFEHMQKLPLIEDRHHQFKNYKNIISNDITPTVMKYIACFLNSEDGGVLYVGVDDDSVVQGLKLSQHQFDKFLLSVDQLGKYNMHPPLMPQKYNIRRIQVYNHRRGRELWVVEVLVLPSPQDRRQGILNYYNRQCYMRMNASTIKMEALDLMEFVRVSQPPPPPPKTPLDLLQIVGQWLQKESVDTSEAEEMKKVATSIGRKLQEVTSKKTL